MTDAQTLELVEIPIAEIARPNHSLILADRGFMSTLAKAEQEGAGLATIKDAVGAQAAASLQVRVTKAETLLNKSRLDLIRPYQNLIDSINEAAKDPKSRLIKLKNALSLAQTVFTQEQARIAREEQERRARELRDMEAKLAKEKKDAEDKAALIAEQVRKEQEQKAAEAEKARIAGIVVIEEENWDLPPEPVPEPPVKSATEIAIEAVRFAPAPVVQKAQGVRTVTTLVPFIENVALLPDMFVDRIPKIAAIRSTFCAGFKPGDAIPVLAGCRFEIQTSTQSTGRAQF